MFEKFLKTDGPVALVIRERLRPVGGKDSVIFPPTYAPAKESSRNASGYNIDETKNGNRCVIDSVQSQANRIEAEFQHAPYSDLVPQIIIKAGDKEVNLLDAAHRLGDAAARFSDLEQEIDTAFNAFLATGNCEDIIRLSPMSLVFGVWDSRGTQAKISRIVRSEINAENVTLLSRSSQFVPSFTVEDVDNKSEETLKAKEKDKWSEAGMAHVPAHGPGGVLVNGRIIRETILNLVSLRKIKGSDETKTRQLQSYILGLSLICATMSQDYDLRSGCQLVRDGRDAVHSVIIERDGEEVDHTLTAEKILDFTREIVKSFQITPERTINFDTQKAKQYLNRKK
jgi:CRISPR-associated protein Csb1